MKKPNAYDEKLKKEKEAREDLIASLIAKSRRQQQFNPLAPVELNKVMSDWFPVLRSIPTERLEEAFTLAMQEHKKENGPFGAFEVVQAYCAMQDKPQREASHITDSKDRCPKCFGSGFIKIAVNDPNNPAVRSATKRCDCGSWNMIDHVPDREPMPADFKAKLKTYIGMRSFK